MSGGVAYVYDPNGEFETLCNPAMVTLSRVEPASGGDDPEAPRQRSVSVENSGMGDMLRFDAERIRILVERHLLHTGSARAKAMLADWEATISKFVKVMPVDYARALTDMKNERAKSAAVAAE
jgi:glutamate synthase (NADPH/NADH) large chain